MLLVVASATFMLVESVNKIVKFLPSVLVSCSIVVTVIVDCASVFPTVVVETSRVCVPTSDVDAIVDVVL